MKSSQEIGQEKKAATSAAWERRKARWAEWKKEQKKAK